MKRSHEEQVKAEAKTNKVVKGLVFVYAALAILIILFIGSKIFDYFEIGETKNIISLLNEKYDNDFEIAYNTGVETQTASDLPTLKKTGYITVIAELKDKKDIKFEVRYNSRKKIIVDDNYIFSLIFNNTARKIEKDYQIGDDMYVYVGNRFNYDFSCIEDKNLTLFDVDDDKGRIEINIYYSSKDNSIDANTRKDYLNKLAADLSLNFETECSIYLIEVKDGEVSKFKDYYENDNKELFYIFDTDKGKELQEKYVVNKDGKALGMNEVK